MTSKTNLKKIEEKAKLNDWGQRIWGQLKYAKRLSRISDNKYDNLIKSVVKYIMGKDEAAITETTVRKSEEMLAELQTKAKSFTLLCAGHAHIDMNWQWRWDETVSITMDTFRTVLDLMDEYPEFKFSQSQASVYKIMEKYDPETLEEIKERIHEGRWEVTASTWVEADKNIPNGESMARQLLYTKNYLSDLLEIAPESLNIDFEPDTFGHSINVPEVLSQGGVKYYYHCRGYDGHNIYRWQAKSGETVLVYREPDWYNGKIDIDMVEMIPEFCNKHGLNHMLKVYGVGDHGGGPTRRDLEKIIDMKNWPVFPQIKFATFKDHFEKLDQIKDELPVVDQELNFVFTGCYTTQSRIKKGNRITENSLVDAEIYNSISDLSNSYSYDTDSFFKGWENVLLNQFHDILPGSGTIETREHALGLYQNTLAEAGSKRKLALNNIAQRIDTSQLIEEEPDKDSVSEGAGVGYGVEDFKISQSSRGRGKTRIFHVFNPAPYQRKEIVEIMVWDWQGDNERIIFEDVDGNPIKYQILKDGFNHYWGHSFIKILIEVEVPACGYDTYIMKEDENYELAGFADPNPRVFEIEDFILENDYIKAEFDCSSGALISLIDKETGSNYIDSEKAGIFRIIDEDESKGMTSWRIGRYMDVYPLDTKVKVKNIIKGELLNAIQLETSFRNSSLKVVISLDKFSKSLNYKVECDWQESGKPGDKIPQLNYILPLGYESSAYKYDVPFGTIEREGMRRDVPANSFVLGVPVDDNSKSLMLMTDSKYGFRSVNNSMAVTLIRGAFDPDPYPELGKHEFKFTVGLIENENNIDLIESSFDYNHSLQVVSGSVQSGTLETSNSFIELKQGSTVLSAIKKPETEDNDNKYLIRLYEVEGQEEENVLSCFEQPVNAYFVDINENKIKSENINIKDNKVMFTVEPYKIATICIEF